MMCCGAASSGGVSIDIESRQAVGISREPSFSIQDAHDGDDTLKLAMQPSRNTAKARNPNDANPVRFLQDVSHKTGSDETKFSLFESQQLNFSFERKMQELLARDGDVQLASKPETIEPYNPLSLISDRAELPPKLSLL